MMRTTKANSRDGISYFATPIYLTQANFGGGINPCPPKQSLCTALYLTSRHQPYSETRHAPCATDWWKEAGASRKGTME